MFTIISSAAGICALRRLHLHADGKANYGQGREERYCGFPEADCTYPIFYGVSLANLAGGNMQGSCNPPGPGQIWSEFSPQPEIPQAINDWVQSGQGRSAEANFVRQTLIREVSWPTALASPAIQRHISMGCR
jgi:hypothetical protein